jgi:hypothetical protein
MQSLANRTNHHNLHAVFDTTKDGGSSYENNFDVKFADNTTVTCDGLVHRANSTEVYSSGCYIQHVHTTSDGRFQRLANYREQLKPVPHTNTDDTISPASGNVHYLPVATRNNLRTVPTTGIFEGEWLLIKRTIPTGVIGGFAETIQSESGQVLYIFGNGRMGAVRLDFDGTDWIPGPHSNVVGASLAGTGLYGN